MTKNRKRDDHEYYQLSLKPDEEEILEEMNKAISRAENKILRTQSKFRNAMIDALIETMLETDKIKKELLETVRELKRQTGIPITEKDLPF